MRKLIISLIIASSALSAEKLAFNNREGATLEFINELSKSSILGLVYNYCNEYAMFYVGMASYYPSDKKYQDDKVAFYFFSKSASLGCGAACYYLSLMYNEGQYVKKDKKLGMVYLRLAKEFGHRELEEELIRKEKESEETAKVKTIQETLFVQKRDIITANIRKREETETLDTFLITMKEVTEGDDKIKWDGK